MRRALFLLGCVLLVAALYGPVRYAPDTAADLPADGFEARVWAMIEARRIVGSEFLDAIERARGRADAVRDRVVDIAGRVTGS